jgi:ubiquinone/menaquinone biosynthesis C-methylase UbiE
MHEVSEEGEHGWRFPPERRHLLNSAERRQQLQPDALLAAAEIKLGERVVDVGAGTGFWTLPLAKLVGPSGQVIAIDVEPIMLDELRALVEAEQLRNVAVVQSDGETIPLADQSVDMALLAFVLHEPPDPATFLRVVRRLLKPNGRLLLIDWQKRVTERGPPVEHRIAQAQVQALLECAELEVTELSAPNPDVYVFLGRVKGHGSSQ